MRRERKVFDMKKRSQLNHILIDHLNQLNFDWGKNKGALRWEEHFKALQEYRAKHGDCNVPTRRYKENIALGRFVTTLRSEYRKRKQNKTSVLTDDQINRLDAIDFCWRRISKKETSNMVEQCDSELFS